MKKNSITLLSFLLASQMSHGMISRTVLQAKTKPAIAAQARLFTSSLIALNTYNPYKVLGLTQATNPKEIKAAYHRLAKQCHPNVAGGRDEAFCQLHKAYEDAKKEITDKNVFNRCNITYTDSLIIDPDLAEFVSPSGIPKELCPPEMQEFLCSRPSNHEEVALEVFHVNDQVGFGVKTLKKISKDSLIKPYTGIVKSIHYLETKNRKYALTVFGEEMQLIIDAEFAGNETRFFNHSYDPNCVLKLCLNEKDDFFQCCLVASRDIQAGEELVWNYGSAYWRSNNIMPFEKNIRHLYQDEYLTIYSRPKGKGSDATLYINDRASAFGEILGLKDITIGSQVFIVVVFKKDEKAKDATIYLKGDESLKLVQDISMLSKEEQAKITEYYDSVVIPAK